MYNTEEKKELQPQMPQQPAQQPMQPIYIEKNDNKNLLMGILIGALIVLVAFCVYLLANNGKSEQPAEKTKTEQVTEQQTDKTANNQQQTTTVKDPDAELQAAAEQKAKATATQPGVTTTQQSRYQSVPKNEIYEGMYLFSGKINKYPIVMDLVINGHDVSGTYYYTRYGSNARLYLQGTLYGNELDIYENNDNGEWTGHFYGRIKRGVYSGTFTNYQGKQMSFTVSL